MALASQHLAVPTAQMPLRPLVSPFRSRFSLAFVSLCGTLRFDYRRLGRPRLQGPIGVGVRAAAGTACAHPGGGSLPKHEVLHWKRWSWAHWTTSRNRILLRSSLDWWKPTSGPILVLGPVRPIESRIESMRDLPVPRGFGHATDRWLDSFAPARLSGSAAAPPRAPGGA